MTMLRRALPAPFRRPGPDETAAVPQLPPNFLGFVWRCGAADQVWLTLLSVAVSLLGTAPIELQRRIVNQALGRQDVAEILRLAAAYLGLALALGLAKLLMNTYRASVGADATRMLRIVAASFAAGRERCDPVVRQGVKLSMIVAEAEAVGGFVGECVAEPVLEISMFVAVLGYMVLLSPMLALVSGLVLLAQMIFVPVMQRAINRRVQARIVRIREAGAMILADGDAPDPAEHGHAALFGEVYRLEMGVFILKYVLNFLMNMTTHGGVVAILGLGVWMVVNGQTLVGTVVVFLSGLANINDPWGNLVNWFQNVMVTGAKYRLIHDAVTDFHEDGDCAPAGAVERAALKDAAADVTAPRRTAGAA